MERICQEELQKLRYLHGRLSRLGKVTLYTPPPEERFSAPVLSFNLEGVPSERVGEFLAQGGIAVRCGLHCAPLAHEKLGTLETGTVRVSPSAFDPERRDLDRPGRPALPVGGNKFRESRKNFFYLRFFYAIILCRKP